jgi:hypothetical protein
LALAVLGAIVGSAPGNAAPPTSMTADVAGYSTVAQAETEGDLRERRKDVRRPGRERLRREGEAAPGEAGPATQPTREPLPAADLGGLGELAAFPDRWRVVDALGYARNLFDPYNTNNPLKGDKPFAGDWFFSLGVISDTVIEPRYVPTPVGTATSAQAGSNTTLGDGKQLALSETVALEFVLYKGDTVFRPPDFEFRFIPAYNYNQLRTAERGVVNVNPANGDDGGTDRTESFVGIQTLFADVHLRNVSDRYDFDSLRVGIQPFNADFRGFLFLDQPFGARVFGTRANNRVQYNLGWFRRLDKDVNSGLNDVSEGLRKDDVFVGNIYWQDTPALGFTSQVTAVHNRNREGNEVRYDENGFLSRPSSVFDERGRDYDVTYLGYSGDGHFGRLNLSGSVYYAVGKQRLTAARDVQSDISAYFAALEASIDFDWTRLRFSGVYGSADTDPFDDKAEGFDAIFENPQIAGADTSYYIRQGIPLIGGGGVALSQRNGVINSLRSSKEQGQSNFINPGIALLGVGADFDLWPELRLSANVNELWFNDTAVLEALRAQGSIDKHIGTDVSMALTYRPALSQNIVLRLSAAVLLPGQGYKQLFGDDKKPYSILANIILAY